MNKILIVGQAPPAVKQQVPYDTTLLYDWLKEAGISKERALEIFEFEAVSPIFRGRDKNSGHKKPLKKEMDEHWKNTLAHKVARAEEIIILGNVARDYLKSKNIHNSKDLEVYEIIHPSKRNLHLFRQNKDEIIDKLQSATRYHEFIII